MGRPIVSVIGEGDALPGSVVYQRALEVGRWLVEAGFRVMTGGLGGVMEAACRGAHQAGRYQEGDTIGVLPGLDASDANPWVDIPIPTGLSHARNSILAQSDAVVAVGGAAGTLTEIGYAWIYKRLIVGLLVPGWSRELAGKRVDHRVRYADIPDDQIFYAQSAEQAVSIVVERISRYQRG